ncbi:unnamed protein product [Durusdinium trenchii]|uniref:Uncharacterized protein n=2 Tax=Durusdinium trenchii TaxID=1381693 RepID=A0ABP0J2Z4_9DINO
MELPQDMQAWLVLIARIALPIFILFVTFGPKIDAWLSSWGPSYEKDELLRHWKLTKGCEKPSELGNLVVVTAETAPLIFQKPEVPERPKTKGKKLRPDPREREDGRRERREDDQRRSDAPRVASDARREAGESKVDEKQKPPEPAEDLKRMRFESLVNFMAFNRPQPQRVFLPVGMPPAPPSKQATAAPTITGKEAQQANVEAQMVLAGGLELEPCSRLLSGVAKSLYEQLSRASVEIQPETFSLMVRACIKVVDLGACSEFLCKIEAAGQALDNALMDQVMELYWDQKKVQDSAGPPSILPAHLRNAAERARALGPLAVPVPPPPEQPAPRFDAKGRNKQPSFPAFSVPEEFKAKTTLLSSDAPEFLPGNGHLRAEVSSLSPEAEEFEPFNSAKFQGDLTSLQ